MSDTWSEIQEIQNKRNSLREKLQRRKKERQDILKSAGSIDPSLLSLPNNKPSKSDVSCSNNSIPTSSQSTTTVPVVTESDGKSEAKKPDPEIEKKLICCLSKASLTLPITSRELAAKVGRELHKNVHHVAVMNLLQKFAAQQLISVKEDIVNGKSHLEVISAEPSKLLIMTTEEFSKEIDSSVNSLKDKSMKKRKHVTSSDPANDVKPVSDVKQKKYVRKEIREKDIMSLLSMPSAREKESKKIGEEILDLLSKPTAKERSLAERFRSQGGAQVMEFCPHGTKVDCAKTSSSDTCKKLHFKKIIQNHTDESLGDCSFLNTCFHMDTCKYVHYEVDGPTVLFPKEVTSKIDTIHHEFLHCSGREPTILYPAQWIQCDLRYLDMTVLGKFAVIMADPPWDIHMELPYGTMSDDEMRQLGIPTLQDEGLIFLWVTGRAMELGRECLKLWGYERVDEIIWVKTNQLQRIIRTGRTGHWLNHGKEHCLVGMKGNPATLNRGLDCDVITAEVRATSHKPDEIYGIIERLSPGTRKIELFGRPHNVQPNWITLGNQVDGVKLVDPDLIEAFKERYPDGNCMVPPKS